MCSSFYARLVKLKSPSHQLKLTILEQSLLVWRQWRHGNIVSSTFSQSSCLEVDVCIIVRTSRSSWVVQLYQDGKFAVFSLEVLALLWCARDVVLHIHAWSVHDSAAAWWIFFVDLFLRSDFCCKRRHSRSCTGELSSTVYPEISLRVLSPLLRIGLRRELIA